MSQETVICSYPGCNRSVDLYTCDHCGKPYCQLHVSFDQVMRPSGIASLAVFIPGAPVVRAKYAVICHPDLAAIENRHKRQQLIITLVGLALIVCCNCLCCLAVWPSLKPILEVWGF